MPPLDDPEGESNPELLCELLVRVNLIVAYGRLARAARRGMVDALELGEIERGVIADALTLPAAAKPGEIARAERAADALRDAFEKAEIFLAYRH